MIIDIILVSLCVLSVYFLNRSFKNDPFSYFNVVLTGLVMVFSISAVIRSQITAGYGAAVKESGSLVWEGISFLWQFSRILFIPICFICLFLSISNVFLLKKEGFRRSNLLGLIFSTVYLIVINCIWQPLNTMPEILNRLLIFIRLMLCYAECTMLSICIMGYVTARIEPRYDSDFVIILGCSISKKGKVRPLLKGRVNRAIRYAWDQEIRTGKPVKYVPSGGQGKDEPMSEGSAMEMYLLSHSAEDYEVFPEKKSKNTMENLVFSKKIIDGLKENAKVAVVTNNFHILRSGMLANAAGFYHADMAGSSTKWYFWPNAFLRELVAIVFMHMRCHLLFTLVFAAVCFFIR